MTVKILVAYHKPSLLFKDEILTPVNGGRSLARQKCDKGIISRQNFEWLIKNTIGDDSGENISLKNSTFNEMSILYWAWKNYDSLGNPDFIGLCHYRRLFLFNEDLKKTDPQRWTYDISSASSANDFLNLVGYSAEKINSLTEKYAAIAGTAQTALTVKKQYCKSTGQYEEDLNIAFRLIEKNHPEMVKAATEYFAGTKQYFCNMFILRKDLFFQYCDFIFPILNFIDEKNRHDDLRSEWEKRLFVSERLTGVFIRYLIGKQLNVKEVPVALLNNTDLKTDLEPVFPDKTAIVFAVDRNYLPYLQVALLSLLKNQDKNKRHYDIVIMHDNLSDTEKKGFLSGLSFETNTSVRFFNVAPLADSYKKEFYIEIHVTLSTYYRFFIEDIFKNFEKVIYLDCDIIINDDIAKLCDIPLNGHVIGAAHDVREVMAGKLNLTVSRRKINWKDYLTNTLKLKNWKDYFQAGVLVFDVQKAKQIGLKKQLINKLIEIKTPILSDQDILNAVCQGDVEFLPIAWNVEWQIPLEFPEYEKLLPGKFEREYVIAYKNPKIMHYASPQKPWRTDVRTMSAFLWWKYAQESSYIFIFEREWIDRRISELGSSLFSHKWPKHKISYYLPNHRANRARWIKQIKKIFK